MFQSNVKLDTTNVNAQIAVSMATDPKEVRVNSPNAWPFFEGIPTVQDQSVTPGQAVVIEAVQ